jgi:hypothetical protein
MLHFPSQKTLFERKKNILKNLKLLKKLFVKKKTCYSTRVVIHIAIGCFVFTMKERYERCKARAFESNAFVTS